MSSLQEMHPRAKLIVVENSKLRFNELNKNYKANRQFIKSLVQKAAPKSKIKIKRVISSYPDISQIRFKETSNWIDQLIKHYKHNSAVLEASIQSQKREIQLIAGIIKQEKSLQTNKTSSCQTQNKTSGSTTSPTLRISQIDKTVENIEESPILSLGLTRVTDYNRFDLRKSSLSVTLIANKNNNRQEVLYDLRCHLTSHLERDYSIESLQRKDAKGKILVIEKEKIGEKISETINNKILIIYDHQELGLLGLETCPLYRELTKFYTLYPTNPIKCPLSLNWLSMNVLHRVSKPNETNSTTKAMNILRLYKLIPESFWLNNK